MCHIPILASDQRLHMTCAYHLRKQDRYSTRSNAQARSRICNWRTKYPGPGASLIWHQSGLRLFLCGIISTSESERGSGVEATMCMHCTYIRASARRRTAKPCMRVPSHNSTYSVLQDTACEFFFSRCTRAWLVANPTAMVGAGMRPYSSISSLVVPRAR